MKEELTLHESTYSPASLGHSSLAGAAGEAGPGIWEVLPQVPWGPLPPWQEEEALADQHPCRRVSSETVQCSGGLKRNIRISKIRLGSN